MHTRHYNKPLLPVPSSYRWPDLCQRGKIIASTSNFPDRSVRDSSSPTDDASSSKTTSASSDSSKKPFCKNESKESGGQTTSGWLQFFRSMVIAPRSWVDPLFTIRLTRSDWRKASYIFRWWSLNRQNKTCSFFPGIRLTSLTSFLSLRSKWGLIKSHKTRAHRYANCNCMGETLKFPPLLMGSANSCSNAGSVPNRPGKIKSMMDQSSCKSLWMGVPLSGGGSNDQDPL